MLVLLTIEIIVVLSIALAVWWRYSATIDDRREARERQIQADVDFFRSMHQERHRS